MYRFRRIAQLLDQFHELEKQEIYFAAPVELNDPMEGFRDTYWKGDKILWKNLFKNYLKSVEHYFTFAIILEDTKELNENDVLVSFRTQRHQFAETISLLNDLQHSVFQYPEISALPEALSKRTGPVRREELSTYLRMLLFLLHLEWYLVLKPNQTGMGMEKVIDPISTRNFGPIRIHGEKAIGITSLPVYR